MRPVGSPGGREERRRVGVDVPDEGTASIRPRDDGGDELRRRDVVRQKLPHELAARACRIGPDAGGDVRDGGEPAGAGKAKLQENCDARMSRPRPMTSRADLRRTLLGAPSALHIII